MTTVQKVAVGARGATNTTPMVAKGANSPARERVAGDGTGGPIRLVTQPFSRYVYGFIKWQVEVIKAGRLR